MNVLLGADDHRGELDLSPDVLKVLFDNSVDGFVCPLDDGLDHQSYAEDNGDSDKQGPAWTFKAHIFDKEHCLYQKASSILALVCPK